MGLNNTRGVFGSKKHPKQTETAYRTAALHKMSGNGAYPEKYKDEYRYLTSPSVHPNELCIENVMTFSVRTAIASLL